MAVASRALAAIGGGYLLSAACAATGARAMVWLGVERADAALGSTLLSVDEAKAIVQTWVSTAMREARYIRRLTKIADLERRS